MSKEKGRKWDGKSRVSNNTYRKRWKEIFENEYDSNKEKRMYKSFKEHGTDMSYENEKEEKK